MRNHSPITDHEILEAALSGLQSQLTQTNERIASIRARLGQRPGRPAGVTDGTGQATSQRRKMSAAARKRISEATRLRWEHYRKVKGQTEEPAAKKRKFSMAGLKAIQDASRKRWATFYNEEKATERKAARKGVAKTAAPKQKAKSHELKIEGVPGTTA